VMRALGCTCSALRPTVVHPCSCVALAWHGCRLPAACSTRRYDDSPRARGHSTQHPAMQSHEAAQRATWSVRVHREIWPVLPSAQRRPKSGKNESGRLPGFQLTRTDSPARLAVYCLVRVSVYTTAAVACLVVAVGRGGSSLAQ
jgi:hypothetical protein